VARRRNQAAKNWREEWRGLKIMAKKWRNESEMVAKWQSAVSKKMAKLRRILAKMQYNEGGGISLSMKMAQWKWRKHVN